MLAHPPRRKVAPVKWRANKLTLPTDDPLPLVPYDLPEKIPESSVQQQIIAALHVYGFVVISFSQARETEQTEGIPDLCAWHETWGIFLFIEVKRPECRVTVNGKSRQLQAGGKRSWEQEQLFWSLRRCIEAMQWWTPGIPLGFGILTADSVDLVLSYINTLGGEIPAETIRVPYDPARDDARFTDRRAKPRHHYTRVIRKSGRRVHLPRSYWARRLGVV